MTRPDQLKWNARYAARAPEFGPHPLAELALTLPLPPGPVLELASGPSGTVLLAAAAGRQVTAVDAADVALAQLQQEAARRQLGHLVHLVHADLQEWRPPGASYALVLCTGYWDPALFAAAAGAVAPGGLLGWEALTATARRGRPGLNPAWCLGPGEPASLLPDGFTELPSGPGQPVLPETDEASRRRMLARRGVVR